MAGLFISYSRKDIVIAHRLTETFRNKDLDFWIDWEGIPPTVDWWMQIKKGIEEADIFLFLISPDSVKSSVCNREIEHAVRNGKRLIPIVVRDVQGDGTPPELRQLNWIFLREIDNFEASIEKLITAIKTDYDWVQIQRGLQVKALEWERANRENSFLLRGIELQNAEIQLASNGSKEPFPTSLIREYILRSRQADYKQRQITLGIAILVAVSLAGLAIFGFVQAGRATANAEKEQMASTLAVSNANTAQAASTLALNNAATAEANAAETLKQYKISRSNELAAEAINTRDTDFQVSSLLAIEALNASDTIQARSVLLENLRMNPQAQSYLLGHNGSVCCMAFSPDGTILATASDDGAILLWNTETFHPFGEPLTQHTAVTSLAFSPDGKMLASGSADKTVRLWNVKTGLPLGKPLAGHTGSISSVAFTKEGQILASWGMDGRIIFWDVKTFKAIGTLRAQGDIRGISLSPDGQKIATIEDSTIKFWDMETFQPIGQPLRSAVTLTTISFSPDGTILASGSVDGSITFWDVQQRNEIYSSAAGVSGSVQSIAFSVDGKTLVSGSNDGEVVLHYFSVGERRLGVVLGGLKNVAISPDGKTVAVNEKNRTVLWNIEQDRLITRKLGKSNSDLNSIAFSPDGRFLASGYFSNATMLWDLTQESPAGKALAREPDGVITVRFSQDGKLLALQRITGYGHIDLWNMETKQFIDPPLDGYQIIDFSPDGKTLVLTDPSGGTVLLWNLDTGKQVGQPLDGYHPVSPVNAKKMIFQSPDDMVIWDGVRQEPIHIPIQVDTILAISNDCKFLASKDFDGDIQLWNLETHKSIGQPFRGYTYWISATAFSPDDKLLATSVDYGTINLWDVSTGELLGAPLRADNGIVPNLTFSPDGKFLAAGATIKTILWDMETRTPMGQPLEGANFGLTPGSQAFSPDGKWFATISPRDKTIILWDLNPESWKYKTCQRVGRNLTLDEWIHYFPNEEYRVTCPQWPAQPEFIPTPQPAG